MHNYKLIIFDWDGTLMDSVARIVFSMQASARIINMEVPTFEQAKKLYPSMKYSKRPKKESEKVD